MGPPTQNPVGRQTRNRGHKTVPEEGTRDSLSSTNSRGPHKVMVSCPCVYAPLIGAEPISGFSRNLVSNSYDYRPSHP